MKSSHRCGNDSGGIGGFPWRALSWSLAAHVLVLLALVPLLPHGETAVPPAQRLLAHLRSVPEPNLAVPPAPTFPAPAKSTKSAAYPTLAAQTTSTATAAPIPSAPPATPVAPGGELVAVAEAAPSSVALPPAPAELAAPDAAGLRQYRLALASEARRYKRYPEAARRAGLAGTVEVRIQVATSGIAPQTELARSSGHAQLDTAAVEMLRLAAARAALPEALRHRQFAVLLPVVFEVEE